MKYIDFTMQTKLIHPVDRLELDIKYKINSKFRSSRHKVDFLDGRLQNALQLYLEGKLGSYRKLYREAKMGSYGKLYLEVIGD